MGGSVGHHRGGSETHPCSPREKGGSETRPYKVDTHPSLHLNRNEVNDMLARCPQNR
jgi:hypothetical protein